MTDARLVLRDSAEGQGRRRLALVAPDGVVACQLTIDAVQLSDGAGGVVAVGGVGNVATDPAHRRRGLASRLLERSIEEGRACGSDGMLLYGIDGFYERFGWRSCGDERWVRVPLDDARLGEAAGGSRDGTVRARAMVDADRAWIEATYAQVAARTVGARLRAADAPQWAGLEGAEVTVVERRGELAGWVWRGRGTVAERDSVARARSECAVFAELHAVDDDAMVEVVRAAAAVARAEPGDDAVELLTGAPDGHALRSVVRAGRIGGTLEDEVRPTGGAMLLPFTEAAETLVTTGGLYQFLPDRF
ncbi:MAG: N-acetyltransferase [Thermoleophilia bacterium]|nr:N-acetyltransferase [Thermoleophilia bacterium]